jgi:predicted RNA binding protein YcfA (HicA-like mRNA interferase family)
MKRREVVKALRQSGCLIEREGGEHTIWRCPCGQHQTAVPRHTEITAGVIGKIEKQMACLDRGWLQ